MPTPALTQARPPGFSWPVSSWAALRTATMATLWGKLGASRLTFSRHVPRRSRVTHMLAVKGLAMEKWLCWSSMGVAGLMLLLFLLDLLVNVPFGGISATVDIFSILASGVVLYLAWDAMRDLR